MIKYLEWITKAAIQPILQANQGRKRRIEVTQQGMDKKMVVLIDWIWFYELTGTHKGLRLGVCKSNLSGTMILFNTQ